MFSSILIRFCRKSVTLAVTLAAATQPLLAAQDASSETRAQECDRLGRGDREWIAECEKMLADEAGVTDEGFSFLERLSDREAWRDGRMLDHLTEAEFDDVYRLFVIDAGELGYAEWVCQTGRHSRHNAQVRIWASRLFSASMQPLAMQEHELSLELLGVGNSLMPCDLDRLSNAREKFRIRERAVAGLFSKRYSELWPNERSSRRTFLEAYYQLGTSPLATSSDRASKR